MASGMVLSAERTVTSPFFCTVMPGMMISMAGILCASLALKMVIDVESALSEGLMLIFVSGVWQSPLDAFASKVPE